MTNNRNLCEIKEDNFFIRRFHVFVGKREYSVLIHLSWVIINPH
jgi:hypothetical protein